MEKDSNFEHLYKELRKEPIQAPDFVESQILARLRERQASRGRLVLWRFAAFALTILLVSLGIFQLQQSQDGFEVEVNKPYAVRVPLTELNVSEFAEAEIELPEGVYFYSKTMEDLNTMQSLRVAWDDSFDREFIPFVIKSNIEGTKEVLVKFYSEDNKVLSQKKVKLQFIRATES